MPTNESRLNIIDTKDFSKVIVIAIDEGDRIDQDIGDMGDLNPVLEAKMCQRSASRTVSERE